MPKYLIVQEQLIDRIVSKASDVDRQSSRPTKKGGRADRRIKATGTHLPLLLRAT
jgi:hypothetical protein